MPQRRPRGRPPHADLLTPAEWQILDAVRHGMTNRTIAARRAVSVEAVKFHVSNVLRKLGKTSRAELRHWDGVPADSALRRTRDRPGEVTMSADFRLGPIGQIARQVSDLTRAVEWYVTALGLVHLYTFGDLAFFDCGGTRLFLTQSKDGAPVAEQSLLYFRVTEIHAAHRALQGRGVQFIGAPHMIHRHESGVEEWMAFFTDPDGQTLAIMAQT